MKAQPQRTLFETRSVMLFATITLCAAGALRAQAQTAAPAPSFGPAGPPAASTVSSAGGAAPTVRSSSRAAMVAFERADTNKDGQLNAQEVSKLPAMAQRFKELDTDHNGALSRQEFEKGAQS